jgi:hypothetical protein
MRWLAWITLAGCAGTVQWHSALWWLGQVGPSGVAWSVVLEVVALWFWYHPAAGMRTIGAVASAVVLAGPLHHVAAPLWQETAAASAERAAVTGKLDSVRQQIEAQRDTLAGYRRRSAERTGWRDVQERASQRLAELRERERRLLAQRAGLADAGTVALSLVTLLQAVALLLMQAGTITSVTHLSATYRGALPRALQPVQQGAAGPQGAAAPPVQQTATPAEPACTATCSVTAYRSRRWPRPPASRARKWATP